MKDLKQKLELSLPNEPDVPPTDFFSYVTLVYGAKKIGKTSLVANLTDTSFTLAAENVSDSLKIMKRPVPSWEHVIKYIDLLYKEPEKYGMILVDSLPKFYDYAMEFAGEKYGFLHPGEKEDYGASWSKVSKIFNKQLTRLLALPSGLVLTAHETIEKIDTRDGGKFNLILPDYSKQCKKFVDIEVSNVFHYQMRGQNRFLQLRGDDYVQANCCHDANFLTPSGDRVHAVPLGDSPEEAAEHVLEAFDNRQLQTYQDYREEPKRKLKKTLLKKPSIK